jgi:hypothetical protein
MPRSKTFRHSILPGSTVVHVSSGLTLFGEGAGVGFCAAAVAVEPASAKHAKIVNSFIRNLRDIWFYPV